MSWVNMTKTDSLPTGAFVAAASQGDKGTSLSICLNFEKDRIGYFKAGEGCVVTWGTVSVLDNFQLLLGSGLSWVTYTGDYKSFPSNAVKFGHEQYGDIYMGRCNYEEKGHIGKVTNGFFYDNYNGGESDKCMHKHDILVC